MNWVYVDDAAYLLDMKKTALQARACLHKKRHGTHPVWYKSEPNRRFCSFVDVDYFREVQRLKALIIDLSYELYDKQLFYKASKETKGLCGLDYFIAKETTTLTPEKLRAKIDIIKQLLKEKQ